MCCDQGLIKEALSVRGRAEQIRQVSIRCYPAPLVSFFFQTADRASRAALLHGGFVGQWSSCGERRIRADPGLEESASAAE